MKTPEQWADGAVMDMYEDVSPKGWRSIRATIRDAVNEALEEAARAVESTYPGPIMFAAADRIRSLKHPEPKEKP